MGRARPSVPPARAPAAAASRASRAAAQLERQHDVFQRGERGNQVKRLEHEADVPPAQTAARPSSSSSLSSTPAISTSPGARRIEPRQQRQQRRFAGARGADHGERLARSHAEAHIGENGQRPLGARHGFGQIPGFENDLIWHQEQSVNRLFVLLMLCVAAVPADADTPVILVFGDSISAGYGLPRVEQGWVALLQARLKDQGYGYQVVNASVSGETTAGRPCAAAARAQPASPGRSSSWSWVATTAFALCRSGKCATICLAWPGLPKPRGRRSLLLGMRMPPNYGPQYAAQFSQAFSDVARDKKLPFVAFVLAGIATSPGPHATRRHSSQRGRSTAIARQCVAGAETAAHPR